ncbi:DUF4231 domain-containing protein [Umezawaea sp.]|uniref:DUF4231 domain-containing protein n=1 Tax=Umezawaea sp. TaxID=1955258 RepID=UPI002ED49495
MATPVEGLEDAHLPGLFDSADRTSLRGQEEYGRTVRLSLVLAVVAAATGISSWEVGTAGVDLAAIGTAVALAALLLLQLAVGSSRPEDRWYDGRALAESAKSLAWRFSVGAAPFPKGTDEAAVERRFTDQVSRLLDDAPTTAVPASDRPVVTERMSAIRASDLATRKAVYLESRIADQQRWYSGKAAFNDGRASRYRIALVVVEVLGIAAALAKAFGLVDLTLAGVVATVVAAGLAWTNLKQHSTLARAYSFAAAELAITRARLDGVEEEAEWSAEVADAEQVVSREHTMWRASRSRASD